VKIIAVNYFQINSSPISTLLRLLLKSYYCGIVMDVVVVGLNHFVNAHGIIA